MEGGERMEEEEEEAKEEVDSVNVEEKGKEGWAGEEMGRLREVK